MTTANRKITMSDPQIQKLPLSQCLSMAHKRNPKEHKLDDIVKSINRFGFVAFPTIDEATQTMIAGHGRCEALEKMRASGAAVPNGIGISNDGEWTVPVIRGMSWANETERDAYVIADNQLAIAGGWKLKELADLMADIANSSDDDDALDGLGFDEAELDALLEDDDDPSPSTSSGGGDVTGDGSGKEVNVEGHTRIIGGHRVRPPAQMTNADWTIHLGDCLAGMREHIADSSVDAVVTDPPAGISFMGKGWDDDKGGRDQWIAWLQSVMTEAYRCLKPGGHLLAWALPRTSHWTMWALENAGFEIRDVVYHAFGTGFPKSLDVSKAIDAKLGVEREVIGSKMVPDASKVRPHFAGDTYEGGAFPSLEVPITRSTSPEGAQWEGWGTALKPAIEPWIMVRKPLDGTVAENVLKHGTGGLNIDGCRVGTELMAVTKSDGTIASENFSMAAHNTGRIELEPKAGRWPAHLVLSHAPGCMVGSDPGERVGAVVDFHTGCVADCPVRMLDEQSDIAKPSPGYVRSHEGSFGLINDDGWVPHGESYVQPDQGGGASRFFYIAKPSKAETEAGLGDLPLVSGAEVAGRAEGSDGMNSPRAGVAKGGRRNVHPTKKPIELMRMFVRLITPPGGLVLDPFTGSGTTGLAALVEGCRFVGFEKEEPYHVIASARLKSIIDDPRAVEQVDELAE